MTSATSTMLVPAAPAWHGIDLHWAYSALLGDIRRRTGCLHRAYDVLHDALVRSALANRRTVIQQPHAYLRSVVATVLADRFRDEARWCALPDADAPAQAELAAASGEFAPSAEHLASLRERLRATQRMLDCLPPRCRQVFWLFRVEGCTQREIAERLGLAPKTVENHVMRALIGIRAAEAQLA